MAGFNLELPTEVISSINKVYDSAEDMMKEMTRAGAQVVFNNIQSNMSKSFKTTRSLNKGLKITRSYKTRYDDEGVPIPLIALAREYGTSRGERKRPFMRKAFKDHSAITDAMLKVQKRYIKDEWL